MIECNSLVVVSLGCEMRGSHRGGWFEKLLGSSDGSFSMSLRMPCPALREQRILKWRKEHWWWEEAGPSTAAVAIKLRQPFDMLRVMMAPSIKPNNLRLAYMSIPPSRRSSGCGGGFVSLHVGELASKRYSFHERKRCSVAA